MHEPVVALYCVDDVHQPVVWEARDELYSAGGKLVCDFPSDVLRGAGHWTEALLCVLSWCVMPARAACSARHTVSAVIGSEMSRTPRCHKASITAFPIAAGAPIVPLSLPPFAPSGLLGAGVSMNVVWNVGRSEARGIA